MRRRWTDAELDVLRARYPHEDTAPLARELGRTLSTVYQRALTLGLAKTPERLANAGRYRRGEHYGFVNATDEVCIPTPLPTRAVPVDMPNYLGARVDRLVVVGLTSTASNGGALKVDPTRRKQTKRSDANARWLCRCDCGMYCLRSSRAIRMRLNGTHTASHIEACFQCRQLDKVRRGDMTPLEFARKRVTGVNHDPQ